MYEEKNEQFADVSLVGLDYYRGTTCGEEEPLCKLLQQLSYDQKHRGFRKWSFFKSIEYLNLNKVKYY